MIVETVVETLEFESPGYGQYVDITSNVSAFAARPTTPRAGTISLFAHGSTAALIICKNEAGAMEDLREALDILAPRDRACHHEATTGDPNGFAHIRAAILGPSLGIPFTDRTLCMSETQRILLFDFDVKRSLRKVSVAVPSLGR